MCRVQPIQGSQLMAIWDKTDRYGPPAPTPEPPGGGAERVDLVPPENTESLVSSTLSKSDVDPRAGFMPDTEQGQELWPGSGVVPRPRGEPPDHADATAGQQSLETGIDPILGKAGSNQYLRGNENGATFRLAPNANRLGERQHIRTAGPPTTTAISAAQPASTPDYSLEE